MRPTTTHTSGSRRRSVARRLAAAAGAGALLVAAPATAGAAVPDIEHFVGTFGGIEQEDGNCLEVPFPIQYEFWFNNIVRVNTVAGGLQKFSVKFQNLGTITNLDTGESLTVTLAGRDGDQRVVDNGDGTLTVYIGIVGTEVVRGPDGAVSGVDAGRTEVVLLVDDNGTPTDWDDDTVLSEVVSGQSGIDTLPDYCAYIADVLG